MIKYIKNTLRDALLMLSFFPDPSWTIFFAGFALGVIAVLRSLD